MKLHDRGQEPLDRVNALTPQFDWHSQVWPSLPLEHMLFLQMEAAHTWLAGRIPLPFNTIMDTPARIQLLTVVTGVWMMPKAKGDKLYHHFLHVSAMLQPGPLW